jgi:hypothetical protein
LFVCPHSHTCIIACISIVSTGWEVNELHGLKPVASDLV